MALIGVRLEVEQVVAAPMTHITGLEIRPVAEAMLVDPGRYRDSLARHGADLNMQKARSEAAVILNSSTGQRKLQQLYVDGLALQPLKKY